MLQAMRGNERRASEAKAIASMWLLKGGTVLPESTRVDETVHSLDAASLYAATPAGVVQSAGVCGALTALGTPCTLSDGGALVPTTDEEGGLDFHSLYAVDSTGPSPRPGAAALPTAERAGAAAQCSAGAKRPRAPPAPEPAASGAVPAGILEASAVLGEGIGLSASMGSLRDMCGHGKQRSAVARATYLGFRIRLQRDEQVKLPSTPNSPPARVIKP
jgi:hypothetical protein